MNDDARELIRYGLATGVAFAVDAGLLWTLSMYGGLHYLLAASIGFVAGACVIYLLSVNFVFRHRRLGPSATEFNVFFAIGLLGLAINNLAMWIGVESFALGLLSAKLAAGVATFTFNFLLRRGLLFRAARSNTLA